MNPPNTPHSPVPDAQRRRLFVEADHVVDGAGVDASPGALLVEVGGPDPVVLAAGLPGDVRAHAGAAGAEHMGLPGRVVTPAFVNAHCHLDLTHVGARPFDRDAGFVAWVDVVRGARATDDGGIAASVREGIERAIAGGTAVVGDIAGVGSLVPARELAASRLRGVSFVEFFGVGARQERTIAAMSKVLGSGAGGTREAGTGRVRIGLQPHAPYSAGLRVYRAAVGLSGELSVATHLSETPEETEFVRTGTGPQRALLERLGVWDETVMDEVGRGRRPIAHLEDVLRGGRVLAAHVNDVNEQELHLLAATSTAVAYCPRCSAYFGRELDFGPHRYREMLALGVPVALGTDSVVNLGEEGASRISVLDEMRLLRERDGVCARTLLAMATVHGLRGLSMDEGLGTLAPGPTAGILSLEGGSLGAAIDGAGGIGWVA